MKKVYTKPAICLVELSHSHCLLGGSDTKKIYDVNDIYDMSDEPIKTFTGGDETIGDEDEEDII